MYAIILFYLQNTSHEINMPPPPPPKKKRPNEVASPSFSPKDIRRPMAQSSSPTSLVSDARIYNLPPTNEASLMQLRMKLESSFGRDLTSSEGQIMLQLAIYRQNCKILSELEFLRRMPAQHTKQAIPCPDLQMDLGLPLATLEEYK